VDITTWTFCLPFPGPAYSIKFSGLLSAGVLCCCRDLVFHLCEVLVAVATFGFLQAQCRHGIVRPPRALLESWARAVHTDAAQEADAFLHPSALRWGYSTWDDFIAEKLIFEEYFDSPRRMSAGRGFVRDLHSADAATAPRLQQIGLLHTSADMEKHMKNFARPENQKSYWNWREAFLERRREGIDMASGSTALEAMWKEMRQLGFDHSSRLEKELASVFLKIAFLRMTYRRANAGNLPTLARNSASVGNYLTALSQLLHPGGGGSTSEWCSVARAKWRAYLSI